MKMKLTVLVFFTSMLLTGQVLAFDVDGLSYNVINATDVRVMGRASGNAATDIVIPDTVVDSGTTYSVTTIGDSAFYNSALTSAAFKGDFLTFNLSMFDDNPTLATITYCNGTAGWPQGFNNGSTIVVTTPINCLSNTNIDGLSYSVIGATTNVEVTGRAPGNTATVINIPATIVDSGTTYSVTTIGDSAFYNNALTSVIIPDSVTTIAADAFRQNLIASVIIPDSVTTIGDDAFYNNALTSPVFAGDSLGFNLNEQSDSGGSCTVETQEAESICSPLGCSCPICVVDPDDGSVEIKLDIPSDYFRITSVTPNPSGMTIPDGECLNFLVESELDTGDPSVGVIPLLDVQRECCRGETNAADVDPGPIPEDDPLGPPSTDKEQTQGGY
ncbi:leucine-rich repeat domain-containing protein [Candidatus Marimicrobium litorale]|nr:leucine-rich repeat domain-containing protein [Candidatus Marimicrobium litorale]